MCASRCASTTASADPSRRPPNIPRGTVALRGESERTFRNHLTQWGHYVQKKMDAAATPEQARALAALAGMDQPRTAVRAESKFGAKPGEKSHSLEVHAPSEGDVTYVFEGSADGGKTYTLRIITHRQAFCVFENLTPGVLCTFQYKVIRGSVEGKFSDPITSLVT